MHSDRNGKDDNIVPENEFGINEDSQFSVNGDNHTGTKTGSFEDASDFSDLNYALKNWAIKFHIPAIALTYLLHILHAYQPSLPRDSRTILNTKVNYNVKNLAGGSYYYFGFKKVLVDVIKSITPSTTIDRIKTLALQFNVDGLPIFKSSNLCFWPILGKIFKPFQTIPFSIALFSGATKPSNVGEYLKDFIEELLSLLIDGIEVNLSHYGVEIDCFVCDAPARAFLKNIKLHNAYYGCEK